MAMVLDALAGTIVSSLADVVKEEVATVLGVKDGLEKLQREMERIKRFLHDAGRKRIQSDAVAGWVGELKDVMYDAEDIIDRCRHEGGALLGGQPPTSSDSSPPVCCGFPRLFSCFTTIRSRREIGDRIKKLNERLEDLYKAIPGLNLVNSEPDARVTAVDRRQTSPVIDTSDIVGRGIEDATNDLVERLVKKDERKLLVFAVTGMGGIGKTTLAKNIFNHPGVKSEFSTTVWVCISQNFSETSLLKEIIRGAGGDPRDLQTKSELEPLLKSVVLEKTFILVLDDVWRADVWDGLLRSPLQSGAVGSRVLVTTRDTNVARQMGAVHIHPVEQLPPESGWELLCKSLYVAGEEEEMQSLRGVGARIVGRCDGLPLAIKSIAGVLTTKERNLRAWEKVLRREAWSMAELPEDLRGALYLSYEDLPSNLKQCFLYCSLLPEDYQFARAELVRCWAAEGFPERQEDSFLEPADECFEELIRRNLIYSEGSDAYKMHDLLRSLAQFLSKDESFCGEAQDLTGVSTATKLRRLTLTDRGGLPRIPQPLLSQRSLRTLSGSCYTIFRNDVFDRFPLLRVLSLARSGIESIPDAVGNLIHLRLLDLGGTRISSLPESIGDLRNLQVLDLSVCYSLDSLPKGITQLCNLRVIEVAGTHLSSVPSGMGRLERLNHFNGFVVGGEQGCGLEDLNSLEQLRALEIRNLKEAVVAQRGRHVLGNIRHLKELALACGRHWKDPPAERSEGEIHGIQDVFEELAPPPRLETLDIDGYFGHQFPSWMMSSSLGSLLPHLTSLSLSRCSDAAQLPPLGLLPELRHLTIFNGEAAASIGSEVYGGGSTPALFPKLESFLLSWMPNLQERSFCGGEGVTVFPNLLELIVRDCPRLKSLPEGLKASPLKRLVVDRSGLRAIDDLQRLGEELRIDSCPGLERISHLPALRELKIKGGCPLLKHVEKLDSLERLSLDDWDMDFLPEGLLGLLQERRLHHDDSFTLELRCCKDALFSKCVTGGEYWPIIQNIPRVRVRAYSRNLSLRYTKEPYQYETTSPLMGER